MHRKATWQRETEPLFDSLAVGEHVIYSSSSTGMLSVRAERDMSPSWLEHRVGNSERCDTLNRG